MVKCSESDHTKIMSHFLCISFCRQIDEEEEEDDDEEDCWSLSAAIASTQEMREREDATLGMTTTPPVSTTILPTRSYFSDSDDSD